ncbi:Glycerol-3-phosphate transporter [Pseudomonas savastanoi pv. glycinea]|nr:Glycerol-3-phosphate transporter [Pseudomonas savastanoi pv. glycinea]
MADLRRHLYRLCRLLPAAQEFLAGDAVSDRRRLYAWPAGRGDVGHRDCLWPVEIPHGDRFRPLQSAVLPAVRPAGVCRDHVHLRLRAVGDVQCHDHVRAAVHQWLGTGHGLAAERADDGPLVVAERARRRGVGVERGAQRWRRPDWPAVPAWHGLDQRLARSILCAGGRCAAGGGLCFRHHARHPAISGPAAYRALQERLPGRLRCQPRRGIQRPGNLRQIRAAQQVPVVHRDGQRVRLSAALRRAGLGPDLPERSQAFHGRQDLMGLFLYEWAGIPGTLLCGWMSDRIFKGNRGLTGMVFMFLVTIATLVYWLNPEGNPTVDMIALVSIGFLIYGPVMLIGLQALELAPKKAAGTAAGFTGLFGYLGGSVAASAAMGYTVDHFGWDGGFVLLIGACILAMAFLAPTLRHKQVASTSRDTKD